MVDNSTDPSPPTEDRPESTDTTPRLSKIYLPMAAAGLAVLVVDQLSKWWATGLSSCSSLVDRPFATFCLAHNEGMAFSVGWGKGPFISALAVVIVIVLVVSARSVSLSARVLMGVVAGGALGNVIDRAVRSPMTGPPGFMKGAVVDFLYTNFWPTFNVADSAIVVGGIVLSILLWQLPDPSDASSSTDVSS